MKLSAALVLLTLASSAFAFEKAYVRGNFRGTTGLTELTFGLSRYQIEKIAQVTDGDVDLKNIFMTRPYFFEKANLPGAEPHARHYLPPFRISDYDPGIKKGWWQQALNVQEAWKLARGRGVTVADCDAGYYTIESDIAGNILMEFARDLSDRDNPTKIDDGGFVSHGTSVAAILVGIHEGKGVNGIAPEAKFVPLQNYNYSSSLDDRDKEEATAACILEALKIPDVQVIVLENQTHGSSETFIGTREAVRLALRAGVTIVSAAGNSSNELTAEAADDTGSIIVGAVNRSGFTESFSNWGKRVSIAAYGSELLTLEGPDGKLGMFGGTSGATPQVAAAVALMLEVNPDLTPAQIKEILVATRRTADRNKKVGGLLNLVEAVRRANSVAGQRTDDGFRRRLLSILSN
jgi:subtilisin family serine protease